MKLGYIILYVRDLDATVAFYERAFGLERRFVHESGYAEMATGDTALAFATEALAASHGGPFRPSRPDEPPAAMELAFTTQDVPAAYERAIAAGAAPLVPPETKPWGQVVGMCGTLTVSSSRSARRWGTDPAL